MRLLARVQTDLLLQWRHGFWLVYAIVSMVYIALLRAAPGEAPDWLLPLVIFTDPALLGLFFIGGLMLFERQDGTLHAAFTTPLSFSEYLASKILSLTTLAVASTLAIVIGGTGLPARLLLLVLTTALTSAAFVALGLAIAARFKTLNGYMIGGSLLFVPLLLPVLEQVHLVAWSGFIAWPSGAALYLLNATFASTTLSVPGVATALVILTGWLALAWQLALWSLQRFVVLGAPVEEQA